MARLVRATYRGTVLAQVARTSRAMTEVDWQHVNVSATAAIHSLRITQTRRATAYRGGAVIRLLTVSPDYDATYGRHCSRRESPDLR
jgi:hypothetical protein